MKRPEGRDKSTGRENTDGQKVSVRRRGGDQNPRGELVTFQTLGGGGGEMLVFKPRGKCDEFFGFLKYFH